MTMKIQTAFGIKVVDWRTSDGAYVKTLPTPNEPNGAWWTLNPQRGYLPVPSSSRALQASIENS